MDENYSGYYDRFNELNYDQYNMDKWDTARADRSNKPYQTLVADFMKTNRRLLVYHGLGSGKTRTGVLSIKNNMHLFPLIICPASLKGTWRSELERQGYKNEVEFIALDAPNFYDQVKNTFIDGRFVIIDECHIFFQHVISGGAMQSLEVFLLLRRMRGSKILLLTATPIVGDPFELIPMFNLLKGPLRDEDGKPHDLFPSEMLEFERHFVSREFNSIKNANVFAERISGLVSYYRGIKDPNQDIVPKYLGMDVITCPMDGHVQWTFYAMVRKKEERDEQIAKFKTEAFKEARYKKAKRSSVGTYRVNSRMASNFGFPTKIEEIYQEVTRHGGKIDWTHYRELYPELRGAVDLPDIVTNVADTKWKLFQYFGLQDINSMERLRIYSNKLSILLTRITSNQDKKKFVFSEYNVLGTRLIGFFLTKLFGFRQVHTRSDYDQCHGNGFIVIDGESTGKDELRDLYNLDNNTHGEYVPILLGTRVVSAGYSFRAVREIYVFEPQWREITVEQVVGRGVRLGSHELLPREERTVKAYIMLSVAPKGVRGVVTTDEHLHSQAERRMEFTNTFRHIMKEAAIDCSIFHSVNDDSSIHCRLCSQTKIEGETIVPVDYHEHLIGGPRCIYAEGEKELKDYTSTTGVKYKMDQDGNLYEENGSGEYEEVGHLDQGKVVLV